MGLLIRCVIGIFLMASFVVNVSAQNVEKTYERGMEAFYSEDFFAAQHYFEEIEATGRSYKDSEYRLEVSKLVMVENREMPLDKIIKFRSNKSNVDKFYHYWMGRIYANRYMFVEALDSWRTFLGRSGFKSAEIREETKKWIADAKVQVAYLDNPGNFTIHQLEYPINTQFAELTPVYSRDKDELLFASNRGEDQDKFSIYHAKGTDEGWNKPTSLDVLGEFARELVNIEVVNEDGRLFYFKDKGKGTLYTSQPSSQGWATPQPFDSEIKSAHLKSHFFINEHEDRIIFATENAKNGLDLMESFRDHETGKWQKPVLLPGSINGFYNEDSPSLSADETKLYFSSDRPGGVGGYDVYVSELDPKTKTWAAPVNLGWPVNSPDDELHFKMDRGQSSGYFSSNRIHSHGDYDIFFFWKVDKSKVAGRVINALTMKPLDKGEIRFRPSQYLDEYFRSPIDSSGRFATDLIANATFKVEVVFDMDTLLSEMFTLRHTGSGKTTHFKDFYIIPENISEKKRKELEERYKKKEELPVSENVLLAEVSESQGEGKTPLVQEEPVVEAPVPSLREANESVGTFGAVAKVIPNIYFEFGTSTLTESSRPRLKDLLAIMESDKNMAIEIAGHTDNLGSKRVNQVISLNRANTVKQWLVEQGVNKDRIKTTGFGETRPLASNDDEKDGRDINRRIEIRRL